MYVCLLLGGGVSAVYPSRWDLAGAAATWAEQAFAYAGILDHAEANASSSSKNLPGGSSLDLLAVTILVQMASVLHSPSWLFWVSLVAVPISGAYRAYRAVSGGGVGGGSSNTAAAAPAPPAGDPADDPAAARRQRRAENRRRKRGL